MVDHGLAFGAKLALVHRMGGLPLNPDHLSILNAHLYAATVVAKSTSAVELRDSLVFHRLSTPCIIFIVFDIADSTFNVGKCLKNHTIGIVNRLYRIKETKSLSQKRRSVLPFLT
jgi:hypothetical protein